MANLNGTWKFTQQWGTGPSYSFPAKLKNGIISISNGKFFGTYAVLGNSNQISLAITDSKGQTITAYVGNVLGNAMGGMAVGMQQGGSTVSNGTWCAIEASTLDAKEKDFHVA